MGEGGYLPNPPPSHYITENHIYVLQCNNRFLILDQDPAPPVGFNLTYVCPYGQVFKRDWYDMPFVMMTCQVNCLSDILSVK